MFRFRLLFEGLLLFISCSPRNFPVIQPVEDVLPSKIAKIKAQEYFIRARDYARRGLLQSAERHYEIACELDPNSAILKEQLVNVYLENGKYTQALLLIKKDRLNEDLSRGEKRTVATIYLKIGEFKKAVELLESVSNKTDEDIYSLGLIYESLGNANKALENYKRYFEENPEAVQIGFKIGKMYIDEKHYSKAESLFLEMKNEYSDNAEIYSQLGNVKIIEGDTASGVAFFDSALAINSTHEGALRSKAQIHINNDSYDKAVVCYEKLYESSLNSEVYGRTLALLYYYDKQYLLAETLLKNLLQSSINDYELHYYLGLVFSASGRYDAARIEFEKTLSIRSEFNEAWRELCFVAIRDDKIDEAISIVDRYVKVFNKSSSAWRLKGYVYSLKKEYTHAIEAIKHAITIDTTDVHSWFELGSAYERNGEIDSASNAFRVVLRKLPDDPPTLNYLGYMWAEKGINLDSASILLQKALKQDENNGAFLDSYAWIFYQQGDIDSAEVYIQKALLRISDDPIIFEHLGDILVKKNDLIGAVEAYRKSLELNPEDSEAIRSKIMEIELLIHKGIK